MGNSSNTNGSLAAVQSMLLNDDSVIKAESNKKRNIYYMVFCAIGFTLLLLLYRQWTKIPNRIHFFHAEQLASADSSTKLRANFYFYDAKILDRDNDYIKSKKDEYNRLFHADYTLAEDYQETFSISNIFASHGSKPMMHYSQDNLIKILGQQLYSKLQDTCKANSINFNNYSEVFFYRHLDNEVSPEKCFFSQLKIICGGSPNCVQLYEKNGFALADSAREKALRISTPGFYNKSITNETIKQSPYRNISNVIVLVPYNNNSIFLTNTTTSHIHSKIRRFIETYLKMEDITQSYYSIKMRSSSITDLYLKMDFLGAISCSYSKMNSIDIGINMENSNHVALNIGKSYIELLRKNDKGDANFEFLVKFNDMQNSQSIRLMILAALITLCLTQFIKSFVKVIEASKKEKPKQKETALNSSDNKETVVSKEDQQKTDDNDIPGFYL